MMHEEFHALGMSILVKCLDIEIRIRCHEIEDIILIAVRPVFPADIPALYQNLVKAMFGSEVDIAAHIRIVRRMPAVRLGRRIIGNAEMHGREVIGICPSAFSGNHFPPHTDIFHRMNPRNVIIGTRLIEIQHEPGLQLFTSIVHHLNRPPRALARSLETAAPALGVRRKFRAESQCRRVQIEVHARVIHQCSLMDIHIEPLVGLHLQGSLHARHRERRLRRIAAKRTLHHGFDFAQPGHGILILLSIVIAWNPERRVIAAHGEFRQFILDYEISHILLFRELITETETIIEKTEAYGHPLI